MTTTAAVIETATTHDANVLLHEEAKRFTPSAVLGDWNPVPSKQGR